MLKALWKMLTLFPFILVLFQFNLESGSAFVIGPRYNARDYLSRFGWMQNDVGENNEIGESRSIRGALMDFQSYFGLSVTGRLDNATITLMQTPRCGVPDKFPADKITASTRRKRYIPHGSRWDKAQLTYRLTKYIGNNPTRTQINNEIQKAFKLWEMHTNLEFVEGNISSNMDIEIKFERGQHGDSYPFRDDDYVLAHAAYPIGGGDKYFDDGDIHFNGDLEWRVDTSDGNNVKQVAAHEIGHSLGLDHSYERGSIMEPFIRHNPDFQLHSDDILGIQHLYGIKRPIQTTTPQIPGEDCTCQPPTVLDSIPHPNMHIPLFLGSTICNGQSSCIPPYSGYYVKHCPDGWVCYKDLKCFKLFLDRKTRPEAQEVCEQNDSILASVHSEDEVEFIKTYFLREHYTKTEYNSTWIGGFKKGELWMWLDLTPFDFSDWFPGYPVGIHTCMSLSTATSNIHFVSQNIAAKMNNYHNCTTVLLNFLCQKFQVDVRRIVFTLSPSEKVE